MTIWYFFLLRKILNTEQNSPFQKDKIKERKNILMTKFYAMYIEVKMAKLFSKVYKMVHMHMLYGITFHSYLCFISFSDERI